MLHLLEYFGGVSYLLAGFRYAFALTYSTIIKEELKKTEKEFNNAIGRWEEVKVRKSPEGTWNDVFRASGWSLFWMWIWPALLLTRGGENVRGRIAEHNAHKIATAVTMIKRNPHIRKIDSELREITIKQLEREVGINEHE